MYLKIDQGSLLFAELFKILSDEAQRNANFKKWQEENLPQFNNDVLVQRSPWYIYSDVVAWKFEGEVDSKTWQPVKGWAGYYEPNKRTKAGKTMRERISEARGQRFNRMSFFDIFKTSTPRYGREFTVPKGFIFKNVIYMEFDDGNYKDISSRLAGHYTEITRGEWEQTADAYNNRND